MSDRPTSTSTYTISSDDTSMALPVVLASAMAERKTHMLTCETRAEALIAYNDSVSPLLERGDMAVTNLCAGMAWRGFEMKIDSVLSYARCGPTVRPPYKTHYMHGMSWHVHVCATRMCTLCDSFFLLSSGTAAPDDLIIFTDADVIVNEVDTSSGMLRRFEAALTGQPAARVVFQAEAFCWAPWAKAWPLGRICSPEVVAGYQSLGYHRLPPRCPRHLNSGGYAGLVRDVVPILRQWRAGAAVLSGAKPGTAWPGAPPLCYRGDQCVVTNLMLRSNGSIGLDTREHLFASFSQPVLPGMPGWKEGFRGGGAIRCGDTKCRAAGRLSNSWRLVGDGDDVDGGHLVRHEDYRAACRIEASMSPALIHFQGVAKDQLSTHEVRDWLRRRHSGILKKTFSETVSSLPRAPRKATDLRAAGPLPALDAKPLDLSGSGGHCMSASPPLTTRGMPLRSLTIVHSTFIDRQELLAHGRALALSSHSWLVHGTLLLAVNGGASDEAVADTLHGTLTAYPQRHRIVCRLPNNGYLCGQFADWHRLSGGWLQAQYEAVLFVESDVYASPVAIRYLTTAMLGAEGGDNGRSAAVWYVAYWQHRRSRAYNMDLFALVLNTSILRAADLSKEELTDRSLGSLRTVWYTAYQNCIRRVARHESPRGLSERAFFHATHATQQPIVVLLNETHHQDRLMDRMGVWHTHNTSAVMGWLDAQASVHPHVGKLHHVSRRNRVQRYGRRAAAAFAGRGHGRGVGSQILRDVPVPEVQASSERLWTVPPVNCSLVVPQAVDSSPVRTPQAAHTLLARRFAGKRLVEIGTRYGDGISCFAHTVRRATAIERDERYCQLLRKRAAQLPRGKQFKVLCETFDGMADKASTRSICLADVVTWWINGAVNKKIFALLADIARREKIRPGAQAVVLFESKLRVDQESWLSLQRFVAWSETVSFDECSPCRARFHQRIKDYTGPWSTCNRAVGSFHVAGVPLRALQSFNVTDALPDITEDWSRAALARERRHFGHQCPSAYK